jgi:hypothetical protein
VKRTATGSARLGALLASQVLLAGLACEKAPQQEALPAETDPQSVVLARVGDEIVTVGDLGFVPVTGSLTSKLEMLVMRKLAAEEARRRGLADDPKVRDKIAQFRNSAQMWEEGLLRNTLYNAIRIGLTFSEAEQRSYFEANRNAFTAPHWKLRIQKFAGEAEARAAAEKLGPAGRLDPAQAESIGPLSAQELPLPILPALPMLKQPGDRQVLDLGDTWALVELEEHVSSAPLSFEAARDKVDRDLRAVRAEEALNQELARLRAEQVTIEQAALARLEEERAGRAAKRTDERAAAREARRARRAQARADAMEPAEPAPPEAPPAEPASPEPAP